jgi:hypothetical protein
VYSTEAPQQTAAVDVMYDGTETIAAYDGSDLPPKRLSELAIRIWLEEFQEEDVCVAITKEPSGDKADFYFACGRFLSGKSEGSLCGRHKQLPYCGKGANAGRVYCWDKGKYAAVCPENECAYMKVTFSQG